MRQLAARPHHHHRAALLALVAPLLQLPDLRRCLRLGISRPPSLSFAHAVPVQHHLAARRPRRRRADRTPRRPTGVDLRRRLLPGLDVEIEVDDMTLALGVVALQRCLRRRLGRAVVMTPTRPPSLVQGPRHRRRSATALDAPRNPLDDAGRLHRRPDRISRHGQPRRRARYPTRPLTPRSEPTRQTPRS